MACNCRKKKPPIGSSGTSSTTRTTTVRPWYSPTSGQTRYSDTATFGSRLEAEAAKKRAQF